MKPQVKPSASGVYSPSMDKEIASGEPSVEMDQHWMQRAIDLSRKGEGHVEPNPMVGCVLTRDNVVIGEGYHAAFGGPHAEVVALRSCDNPLGATAYVTLEPCCHHGKTPPCADALIAAGVARVVIATGDPFPRVSGGGIKLLRDAGVTVEIGTLASEAESVLAPFLKRVVTGLPWVIAKWAMSIDGRIATRFGESQWITGPEARADVHRVRGRVDTIITGMGTVASDDPLLTARPPGPRVATRAIVCRNRLPDPSAKLILTAAEVETVIAVPPSLAGQATRVLGETSARVQTIEEAPLITGLLRQLGSHEATNVVLECGSELMASFFEQNLIDEFHVYIGRKAI
ncbi:MAG: bifunctional diaminohydroxyphosphoribosylaminopyrimidine deaminase/5-amino-6-(5-phosphoribosylamino)uracil reductase RibD, partial [Pseudomonadota bacterium]